MRSEEYKQIERGVRVQVRVNQLWMRDPEHPSRHKPILLITNPGEESQKTRSVDEAVLLGEAKTVATVEDNFERRVCVETYGGVMYR